MDEKYYYPDEKKEYIPKAIIAGVDYDRDKDFDHSVKEMEGLVKACDMECVGILTQSLPHPDNALYLGKGKVAELKDYIATLKADYCIFESDLSPSQMRNLQDELKVPVWDRTNLILEIFSRRAKTKEARLQVESAYLQFMLPRLGGMWEHLSRQGGGGGSRANKGEGEKQIELDKRYINHRIVELSKELEKITKTRSVQRSGRKKGEISHVAMVGYTNAGKSSLMNRLLSLSAENSSADLSAEGTSKEAKSKYVFEKDMLFATLDTSIRSVSFTDGRKFLLSDTVGFIENLPTGLIKAFRSTLEEAVFADLLLIVLDISDPYYHEHKKVTEEILNDLGAGDIPRIYVLNKCDALSEKPDTEELKGFDDKDRIIISALTGEGIDTLLERIEELLYSKDVKMDLLIPYEKGALANMLHTEAVVLSEEYTPEGISVSAVVGPNIAKLMLDFTKTI